MFSENMHLKNWQPTNNDRNPLKMSSNHQNQLKENRTSPLTVIRPLPSWTDRSPLRFKLASNRLSTSAASGCGFESFDASSAYHSGFEDNIENTPPTPATVQQMVCSTPIKAVCARSMSFDSVVLSTPISAPDHDYFMSEPDVCSIYPPSFDTCVDSIPAASVSPPLPEPTSLDPNDKSPVSCNQNDNEYESLSEHSLLTESISSNNDPLSDSSLVPESGLEESELNDSELENNGRENLSKNSISSSLLNDSCSLQENAIAEVEIAIEEVAAEDLEVAISEEPAIEEYSEMISCALEATYNVFLKDRCLPNLYHLSGKQVCAIMLAQEFGLLPTAPCCPRLGYHGPMDLHQTRWSGGRSKLERISIAETADLSFICTNPDHPRVYQLAARQSIFEDSCVQLVDFFRILFAFTSNYPLHDPTRFGLNCNQVALDHVVQMFRNVIEACVDHDNAYDDLLGEDSQHDPLVRPHVQVYNAQLSEKMWALIALEMPSNRLRIRAIDQTDYEPDAIREFLNKHVYRHSLLVTVGHRLFEKVTLWGFTNHQQVDLESLTISNYTVQNVIDLWNSFHIRLPNPCTQETFELAVAEFAWRQRCLANNDNLFINLLHLIRRVYPVVL